MEQDLNQNTQTLSKLDKFPECFANWMNASAFVVIFLIIIAFTFSIFTSKNIEIVKQNQTEIVFKPTGDEKLDIEKFNSIIDLKLNEFKNELKNSEKERNENMKYYSALVGFILAIVGFFGFKSIFDTRQAAIERAVFDAKKEAKDVASYESKQIAGDKAKEVAEEISKIETEKIAKIEIKKYFDDSFHSEMTTRLNTYYDNREDRITKIENDIDRIQRPDAYGLLEKNDDLEIFNNKIIEIEKRYIQLLSLISELKSK